MGVLEEQNLDLMFMLLEFPVCSGLWEAMGVKFLAQLMIRAKLKLPYRAP